MARTAKREFAIYKGDKFICLGTADECAKTLEVKVDTIRFMASPIYRKRRENQSKDGNYMIAIRIDNDE